MQDPYLPPDVVKSTFRRLRSKADNKVRNFFFENGDKVSGDARSVYCRCCHSMPTEVGSCLLLL